MMMMMMISLSVSSFASENAKRLKFNREINECGVTFNNQWHHFQFKFSIKILALCLCVSFSLMLWKLKSGNKDKKVDTKWVEERGKEGEVIEEMRQGSVWLFWENDKNEGILSLYFRMIILIRLYWVKKTS